MSERPAETTAKLQRTPRVRRRRKMIDDPRRPHRLRIGVAYRVVEIEGELVVKAAQPKAEPKRTMCHTEN